MSAAAVTWRCHVILSFLFLAALFQCTVCETDVAVSTADIGGAANDERQSSEASRKLSNLSFGENIIEKDLTHTQQDQTTVVDMSTTVSESFSKEFAETVVAKTSRSNISRRRRIIKPQKYATNVKRRSSLSYIPPPIRGRHPPNEGNRPKGVGKHPLGVGRHPPGVGKHPPGLGRHPPECGKNPPGTGHHPGMVGGHIWRRRCRPPSPPPPPPSPPPPFDPPSPPLPPLPTSGCCFGKGTGVFADINSNPPCSNFCKCLNGYLVSKKTCYEGTIYNEEEGIESCDSPQFVTCGNDTYNVPPPPSLAGLANGGVLTNGYQPRSVFDCDADVDTSACNITALNYSARNLFARYSSSNVQEFVDWRNPEILTPVKLQQACLGCWAFSAVTAVEAAIAINDRSRDPVEFSVQQILDCLAPFGDTCEGGDPSDVLEYIAQKKSIAPASVYPLRDFIDVAAGDCEKALVNEYANSTNHSLVVGWERINPNDPLALMKVVSTQPAIIAISTICYSFFAYSGGIFEDPTGECGIVPNHNLVIIGYGTELSSPFRKYWVAQNSWGTEWGENGYIRILREDYGQGIGAMLAVPPIYPVLNPYTSFGHQNRRVNLALKQAFNASYVKPVIAPPPPNPPSPARPKGGRHPPGVGKRPPGIGQNPPGSGKRPPGVGKHPTVFGDHPPGIGDNIYPPTACNGGLPYSACGNGTCVVLPGAETYSCECADGFVSVTNTDGNQVCALVDVCFSSTFNPCGVGECQNDGQGGYNCTCPSGFTSYIRSADDSLTCGPANGDFSNANTTWIIDEGDTCDSIAQENGLTNEQFFDLNPSVDCNNLMVNESVTIGPLVASDCAVIYTTTSTDTCNSVATLFTEPGYALTTTKLEELNSKRKISCADGSAKLPAHIPLCVAGGNATIIPDCGVYSTITDATNVTCKSLSVEVGPLGFYSLNPGIDCDNLLPGQQVCTSFLDLGSAICPQQRKCLSGGYTAKVLAKLREGIYRVKKSDTCEGLRWKIFYCAGGLYSCFNGGSCSNSKLYVRQPICYPKWRPSRAKCGLNV